MPQNDDWRKVDAESQADSNAGVMVMGYIAQGFTSLGLTANSMK
jgi:hypothetical protein